MQHRFCYGVILMCFLGTTKTAKSWALYHHFVVGYTFESNVRIEINIGGKFNFFIIGQ